MPYATREASAHDGSPIECYTFTGTFTTYRYTSAERDITIGLNTFTAAGIKRNAMQLTSQQDDGADLELVVPYDLQVVQDYAFTTSPPDLDLEVYRFHDGDDPATEGAVVWKGDVAGFSVSGRECKIRVPSIFQRAMRGAIPNRYYHAPCNHVLFDDRCGISRAAWDQATSVTGITDGNNLTVADDGFDDSALKAGEIVNTRTSERRLIIDNIANAIQISVPFTDVIVGDSVILYAGCDHSWDTCGTKFNNKARFGGDPYIPSDDPFQGEL